MKKGHTYGKELILDLHDCDTKKFKRKAIRKYFIELCKIIKMTRCKLYWWDDYGLPKNERQTEAHLKGTSAVQFILTSNIVIHTLDLMGNVYINIFSCKDFSVTEATKYSSKYFKGNVVNAKVVKRI